VPSGRTNAQRAAIRLSKANKEEAKRLKLGRYPFAAAADWYMKKKRHGTVSDNTYDEEERKYRYIGGVFEDLKKQGKVQTTDPRHMKRQDIQEFMAWMRTKKPKSLAPSAQEKLISLLNNLLTAFKNRVIDDMKVDGVRFPRAGKKAVRVISQPNLESIFTALNQMDGWRGSVAKGMLALYLATGLRPKELRLANIEDLNLEEMTLYVQHPKGEGSWAEPEEVAIILEEMSPYIRQYVGDRKKYLKNKGRADAVALFPSLDPRTRTGYYSANGFREIKAKVERLSGVRFKLKDFRPTLTSATVNGDLKLLPLMTAQLRHKDPNTTKNSYALMQRGVAGKQLREVWKGRSIIAHDTPLIEKKFDNTGYS
jgi:integrase/recombinase XerD